LSSTWGFHRRDETRRFSFFTSWVLQLASCNKRAAFCFVAAAFACFCAACFCGFLSRLSTISSQRGKIPAIQIGGRWRIKKSLLDRDILRQDKQGQPTVCCPRALSRNVWQVIGS
jgi:hypothetical protein